jgi:hypothetical protein
MYLLRRTRLFTKQVVKLPMPALHSSTQRLWRRLLVGHGDVLGSLPGLLLSTIFSYHLVFFEQNRQFSEVQNRPMSTSALSMSSKRTDRTHLPRDTFSSLNSVYYRTRHKDW